jgi:hypothetical protein
MVASSSSQQQQRGSSVKENNNGIQQQQRRRQRHFLLWGVGVFALSQIIRKCFKEMGLLPQTGLFETLPSGRKQQQQQRTSSSTVQDILEGRLTLMDLRVSSSSLSLLQQQPNDDDDVNYVVKATFCEIDWSLQQNNPSTVPMFRDLQSQSKHCPSTKLTVDLWTVVQEARKYDLLQVNNNNGTAVTAASQQPPPTGVVFHETRCGSTLVANLLSTMGRTYSESPPPIMALKACGNRRCSNTALHAQLIQDVFYMMGRQPTINQQVNGASSAESPPPPYVFYKIQSIGTFYIDAFVQAMPDVPWVFVYRDTVEILQSHWKPALLLAGKLRKPVCARGMSFIEQQQPPTTLQAIQAAGMKLSDLTMVEYCAAHLAGLSLAALQEYQRRTTGVGVGESSSSSSSSLGRMVHYPQLPNAVWTDLLPDHFGVDPSPGDIARMQDIAEYYSKGRGEEALKAFERDSVRKQETAPKAVQEAAKVLVDDVYQQLLAATKTTTTTTTTS